MHKKSKFKRISVTSTAGFTLLEVMITVAVAGIFLVVAIPSFTDFIARNRVDVELQQYQTAIALARSEAIKQNRSVRITGLNDWMDGYVISLASVTDLNDEANLIRSYTPQDGANVVPTLNGGAPEVDEITFQATGLLAGNAAIVLEFCSDNTTQDRRITIGATGRSSSQVIDNCAI